MSSGAGPLRVAIHVRKPVPGRDFSVEAILEDLLVHLSPQVIPVVVRGRFLSRGLFRRLFLMAEARLRQREVNHILGVLQFLALALDPARTVLTILDCGGLAGPMTLRTRLLRLLWYRLPARRCAAITVISEAVKQDLLRHVDVDPAKVHVVPVAVSGHYAHAPRPFRRQRPVILQVGTAPNKNVTRLVEALAGIPCRLELVGAVSKELEALLARHGIAYGCHLSVSKARMKELYEDCDLVAFASTFEGFGMPIVEANRVGRPVLAGNVTSMPEVAGDAACLVDPFDVAAIRTGILRILEDDGYREELVRRGRVNAERFDAARISRQYEEIYHRVGRTP